VSDNAARTRGHSFPFAGASWVRLTVTDSGEGEVAIDEIDLHDISAGSADSVFFLGDSITAAAFLRCDRLQPSFATLVREAYPGYSPALIDGGVSGVSSDYGVERIDQLLADNPDYAIWAIAYGTNDAYRERPSPVFEEQLQTIIDRVRAAGKEPVLATIPYTDDPDKDSHIRRLNGVIAQLTARNGLRPGPDLYTWFKEHPQELAADGIHPTPVGSLSINRLWFAALSARYEAAAASP
jgi:lysophospholipase L1-like esterase